jgi:hypothetical protein
MIPRSGPAWRLPALAVLAAGAAHGALQAAAYAVTGAVEYPLDDPYIHLAMAEQIAGGTYGINPGETAAAASSVLYPLLLLPFAGQEVQRVLPLAWNLAGLAAAAVLWGRILWQAGWGRGAGGVALALAGPLALNFAGLAFTGMEHMLHAAASLAILSGLLRLLDEDRLGLLLPAGVLLAPLLRYEGLALACLAALVVAWRRPAAGAGLLALALGPLAAFSGFLAAQGLGLLPASVAAKLHDPATEGQGLAAWLARRLGALLSERREQILAVLLALTALFALRREIRQGPRAPLLGVLVAAGLAHALFGRFGWMDRYEIYVLAVLSAGLLALAAASRQPRLLAVLVAGPMALAALLYLPLAAHLYPGAARAVHVQQAQMGRFARDYLAAPVAVNDLGHVAWRNPNRVLDVWGLANPKALELRVAQGQPDGWVNELTEAQGVSFAMLYDSWFGPELLGPGWRRLGQLHSAVPSHYLGGRVVNFYLTDPAAAPEPYLAKLRAWAEDLPPGASFTFDEAAR